MINYILPNFYNAHDCNVLLKKNFLTTKNLSGIQGNFPFSIFHGTYNNIPAESLAVYEDIVDVVNNYGILNNITLIDFGNPLLIPTDYYDCFGTVILDEYANNKHCYFEVALEDFIDFLVETYPNIQLILHQNYTSTHSSKDIENLIKKYPNNIKGIVVSALNECKSITNVMRFYLVPLSRCQGCSQYKKCLELDHNAILEYSGKSQFHECELRQLIYPENIADIVRYGATISDYILFDTVVGTTMIEEYALIEQVIKIAEGE